MHKLQLQVQQFHREVLNQPCSPAPFELRMGFLRARLIAEEAIEALIGIVGPADVTSIVTEELRSGLEKARKRKQYGPDKVEVLDGLSDLAVVTFGAAETFGIDLEPYTDEVMRSNMAKLGGPIREDGKLQKPPGWTPPDIAGVLARETARFEAERVRDVEIGEVRP
jgi:predicted HAD superfamily Cof-like phosphohydrolase